MEKFGLSHPLPPVTQAPGGGESGEGTRQEPQKNVPLSLAMPRPSSPPPFHTHPASPLTTATVCACSDSQAASTAQGGRPVGSRVASPPPGSTGGGGEGRQASQMKAVMGVGAGWAIWQ